MLRVAAIFTLCEKLWTLHLPKHMGKVTPAYGETPFPYLRVALKIGVNPSLSILKYVSETAPKKSVWCSRLWTRCLSVTMCIVLIKKQFIYATLGVFCLTAFLICWSSILANLRILIGNLRDCFPRALYIQFNIKFMYNF